MKIEDDPSTWAYALKTHWDIFTEFAWKGFSAFEEETRKLGHENKVDKMKWREYLLWDMQKRHQEENKTKDEAISEFDKYKEHSFDLPYNGWNFPSGEKVCLTTKIPEFMPIPDH